MGMWDSLGIVGRPTYTKPHMPRLAPNLTEAAVRKLTKTTAIGGVTGLTLVFDDKDNRSWTLRYLKPDGKRAATGLGSYPTVLAEPARARARAVLDELASKGTLPTAQRLAKRADAIKAKAEHDQSAVTFEQCAHIKWGLEKKKMNNAKAIQQWINTLEQYAFPFIGAKFCRDVTKQDIKAILEQEFAPGKKLWWDKYDTAKKLRQRIHKVLAHAIGNDWIIGNNVADYESVIKPMGFTSGHHKAQSHSAMPYKEVPAFMEYLAAHNRKGCGAYAAEFLVLTVARSANVYGARWGQFDLDAAQPTWHIPAEEMKAKRPFDIPLSQQAVDVLTAVRAHVVKKGVDVGPNDFVFPSVDFIAPTNKNYGKMLSNSAISNMLDQYVEDNEMDGADPHGFRSSFRNWGAKYKIEETELLEDALAHAPEGDSKTKLSYLDMQVYFERRIPVMNQWADFIRPCVAKLRAVA